MRIGQTMVNIRFTVPLLVVLFGQVKAAAQPVLTAENEGRVTLGGTQYWTDHLVCHGWRIQRNVTFGQFRLLKPSNRVAKIGTYDACRQAFDSVRRQPGFPPIPDTVLVTVHGLGRTRNSMSAIGSYVSEQGDFGWINFGYASTRSDIDEIARAMRNVLDELASLKREQAATVGLIDEGETGISLHFIGHSLGNIIVRKLLSDMGQDDRTPSRVPWRIGRIVMLGPPNCGSAMANLLHKSSTFRLIAGSSGKDLGAEWDELNQQLIILRAEFAVIAGGKGDEKGYNPLLIGDDDLIVRVDETRLSGAADFALVRSIHTYLMDHTDSKEMALRFLQSGYLTTADKRQPIP